jgi:hypothetical protein
MEEKIGNKHSFLIQSFGNNSNIPSFFILLAKCKSPMGILNSSKFCVKVVTQLDKTDFKNGKL